MKRIIVISFVAIIFIASFCLFGFRKHVSSKGKFANRWFCYVGPTGFGHPTATDVTTSSNFVECLNYNSICNTVPKQILCAICFDDATYAINSSNQPDFTNDASLTNTVSANGLNTANDGQTINGIKFYFRRKP